MEDASGDRSPERTKLTWNAASPHFIFALRRKVSCPTGVRREFLSSPSVKNISLPVFGFDPVILFRHEGRFAIVTNAGWDAVDAGSVGRDRIAGRFRRERCEARIDDRR